MPLLQVFSKYGQQQLAIENHACGFNKSETGKYSEWSNNRNYGAQTTQDDHCNENVPKEGLMNRSIGCAHAL